MGCCAGREFLMTRYLLLFVILLTVTALASPAMGSSTDDRRVENMVGDIATEVETIRGLDFYTYLETDVISSDELLSYLNNELESQVPPEKESAIEKVYGELGLIPEDTGFLETYAAMYEEQAGGIYDWKSRKMLIVSSNLPGLSGDNSDGLYSLMGADPDMILGVVLAHELCHALEDQHFKFHEKFEQISKLSSSDREFALQCLVEGSATLLMIEYATGGAPLSPFQRTLNRLLTSVVTDLSIDLPLYYRRTLTAPYSLGEAFVSSIIENGGGEWTAVNAAYGDIPMSTEQIIHPDKYYGTRDYPSDVQLADFAVIMGDGYKKLLQDTLGELVIGILFDIQLAREEFEEAPRGWDGDRLVGIQGPDGEVTVVWHSVWDTPNDAQEFADTLLDYMTAKIGAGAVNHGKLGNCYELTDANGREYIIGNVADEAILIDNAPVGMGETLYFAALNNDVIVRR